MENSYTKYLELKEEGVFDFDPTNVNHVLEKSRKYGWKQTILFGAMDLIRDNPKLSNNEAILEMAKKYHII